MQAVVKFSYVETRSQNVHGYMHYTVDFSLEPVYMKVTHYYWLGISLTLNGHSM